jgi:hypothetical protein
MKEHEVVIYRTDAMLKVKVEAETAEEARGIAKEMLEIGDGVYSDFHEADFEKSDRGFLYVTFNAEE